MDAERETKRIEISISRKVHIRRKYCNKNRHGALSFYEEVSNPVFQMRDIS